MNDEEIQHECRRLLALTCEYPHELTADDRTFLDETIEEIREVSLPTGQDPIYSDNIEDTAEINTDILNTGIDFIFQLSGLPQTFESIDCKELQATHELMVSVLQLAYKCLCNIDITELNDETGAGEGTEEWGITDELLPVMNDFVTGDYLIKEMVSDLNAGLSLAALGFYKQALAQVRNVLESAVLLSYITIANKPSKWAHGGFGIDQFKSMVTELYKGGVIDEPLNREIMDMYWDYLCTATHSHKARMNAVRTDDHSFDIVRFHEFWGILSWCSVCCLNLMSPIVSRCPSITLDDRAVSAVEAWKDIEEKFRSSSTWEKAELAKQDILYEGKITPQSGRTIGVRAQLLRDKSKGKETKFRPEILFAFPFKESGNNQFLHLREIQGLSVSDHYEIVKRRPRVYIGDADDRSIGEKIKNLI